MTKILTKTRPDPEAEGRQQDLERFTAFRREHDLPFDRKFVPGWWENLADLEHKYASAEDKAEAARAASIPRRKATNAPRYVSHKELDRALETIGRAMRQFLNPYFKRIDELEARPSMQHRGVWRADTQYQQGDVVSHGGSGWVCKTACQSQKPGEAPRHWRLFVKRGRDGKGGGAK